MNEPFAIGSSVVHKIDPRYKIVLAVGFSVLVALSTRFSTLFFSFAVSFLLVCLAHLKFSEVLKRLGTVLWFIVLIWAVLPFTFEGEKFHSIGIFTMTIPGVVLSAQITIKSLAILMVFMALIATMTVATMGAALSDLKLPGKIVYLLSITYRYIFVIEQEYQRLLKATKIRGFKPGTNIHTYKTYAYMVGMLFVRASSRADRVHKAMLCRGFNGKFYTLAPLWSGPQNIIFSIFMGAAALYISIIEWTALI